MALRQIKRNKKLAQLCGDIAKNILHKKHSSVLDAYFHAYISKAATTLRAIVLLQENALWEPAQSLVRVLLETRINFDYLMQMCQRDPSEAVQRLADAMMLNTIKQAKASNYFGFSTAERLKVIARHNRIEKTIAAGYDPAELDRLKKCGFTGLSIESQAIKTGHGRVYSIIYRNFSRNIHSTDHKEHMLGYSGLLKRGRKKAYLASRNATAISISAMAAGGIAERLNDMYQFGLKVDRLIEGHRYYE